VQIDDASFGTGSMASEATSGRRAFQSSRGKECTVRTFFMNDCDLSIDQREVAVVIR